MPDGVDFAVNQPDDGRGPDPGEEVLGSGPRRRPPRWTYGLVALVVAAVVAGIVAKLQGGPSAPVAAPSTSPSPSRSTSVAPGPPTGVPISRPLRTSSFEPPADARPVVFVDDQLIRLRRGWIERTGSKGSRTVGLGLPFGDPRESTWQLISDGTHLWMIGIPARVYQVDPRTLRLSRLIKPPGQIVNAAVLDGDLYLNTDVGIYRVAPGARKVDPKLVGRGGRAMAADPSRHRLLMLYRAPQSIDAYRPPRAAVVTGSSLKRSATQVVVVGGSIWIAGGSPGGLPPQRVDPRTLHPTGPGKLGRRLGAGVTLTAGQHSLWVRSAGTGDQLWCLNPRTGHVEQHWDHVPGTVVSRSGEALVVDGDSERTLSLNGRCRG